MSRNPAEEARAHRAEARRRTWGAIERVPAGEDKGPVHAERSMEERIARLWELTARVWAFGGRTIQDVPRGEWPTEVFEIDHGRCDATGRLP